ncbi:MAG: hypothetical protein ABUT20_41790 [Bacteroidota bacterium]
MSKELDNKEIGEDLCKLAVLLQSNNLCSDITPLQNAGGACISTATATLWKYNLEKITFKADEVGGRLSADSTDILISLSIDIEGVVSNAADIIDPLNKLVFDLEIDGGRINPESYEYENLYSAWHLDRHIFGAKDQKTKYSHPLYHFTFGGNKMECKGHDVYGSALILPAPRIVYPPMDAVLGIDFILQNYLHKDTIKTIIEDPEYIEIQKKAQERIWKPFFCSMYSHWNSGLYSIEAAFTALKIFPLYY